MCMAVVEIAEAFSDGGLFVVLLVLAGFAGSAAYALAVEVLPRVVKQYRDTER